MKPCSVEPRVHHALYSSTKGSGYTYGRVSMACNTLESLCDGLDSINWHADDTLQGEDVILSLIVDGGSVTDPQTICFQPKNTSPLKNGDEQIELFPIPGDGYSMDDGVVQTGCVHGAMLQTNGGIACTAGQMAIIFRNGISRNVDDNGVAVESILAPVGSMFY